MADLRTLKKTWLRDAAVAVGSDITAQLAWLESKRQELSPNVLGGDIFTGQSGFEGGNTTSTRGTSDTETMASLLRAIEELEDGISSGGVIIPQFRNILS